MAAVLGSIDRYLRLKSRIVSGVIPAGEQITEARVSEVLGIGRGPAREALLRLEAEGLIGRKEGRYARRYVRYLEDQHPKTLEQQFDMREALDGLAAREAALNMTGREINEMRAIAAEVARCIRADDVQGRFEALFQFYEFFRRVCGNPLIARAYAGCGISPMPTKSDPLDRRIVEIMKEDQRKKVDLRAVVEAIAAHDPALAETRMRAWTRSMARAVCGA